MNTLLVATRGHGHFDFGLKTTGYHLINRVNAAYGQSLIPVAQDSIGDRTRKILLGLCSLDRLSGCRRRSCDDRRYVCRLFHEVAK